MTIAYIGQCISMETQLGLTPLEIKPFVENSSTAVMVDRYLLSQTWYNLLRKLAGKHPNVVDSAMIGVAYNKIVDRMKTMSDQELLEDMQDIIDAVDFARLKILPLNRGYYKR